MFNKFFAGRNGPDHFNFFILIAGLLLGFIPVAGTYISMVTLAYAIFRMLSKNIAKRQQENQKFLSIWYKIKNYFSGIKKDFANRKTHSVFSCPSCKQKLRVPKGKGKINITCTKCGTKFQKTT